MSVLSAHRELSKMEFYKEALGVRLELQMWLERDIEIRGKAKKIIEPPEPVSWENLPEYIFPSDGGPGIVPGTGSMPEPTVKIVYEHTQIQLPEGDRVYLLNLARDMMGAIVSANGTYVGHNCNKLNHEIRYRFQCDAIAALMRIIEELFELENILSYDLNRIEKILVHADRALELLQKWRYADTKRAK